MTPSVPGSYELRIGGNTNYFFNGRIDDFRVWSMARTPARIQSDFDLPLVGNEAGLLLCYKFNEGSGSVANNSATATGAAFNGTLVNGPAWTFGPPLNTVGSSSDGGFGSLRAIAGNALTNIPITFYPGISGQTIVLSQGPITLNHNVTIDASALSRMIAINGNSNSPVFIINSGVTTTLSSLIITNGYGGGAV